MRRPRRKAVPLAIAILALLVWLARNGGDFFTPRPAPSGDWRVVVRVIDADTIVLENGERIRLIGVDAPETRRRRETCGPEATQLVKALVEGKRVRLGYDWERYDRTESRRTLAYVFLEDGTFLNAEIIRRGYAHAYRKFRYRHKEDFLRYEQQAHEEVTGCLPVKAPWMARE
jgi:micrococcal nuclease